MKYLSSYKLFEGSKRYKYEYGTSYVPSNFEHKPFDGVKIPYKYSFQDFKDMTANLADVCVDFKYRDLSTIENENGDYEIEIISDDSGTEYMSNIEYTLSCEIIKIPGDMSFNGLYDWSSKFYNQMNEMKDDVNSIINMFESDDLVYFMNINSEEGPWKLYITLYQFKEFKYSDKWKKL